VKSARKELHKFIINSITECYLAFVAEAYCYTKLVVLQFLFNRFPQSITQKIKNHTTVTMGITFNHMKKNNVPLMSLFCTLRLYIIAQSII